MQVHQALRGTKVFLDSQEVQLKALKETEDPKANLVFQVYQVQQGHQDLQV